ncbi:uncharacterized protein J8A68_005621 [[Candida] subhashii]|uniref:Aminopeptidase n=1 Tax=[Candida] subhashii TaxID=561895 RepID=A0A8J5QER0_9ASCO|nr:uncharacterized protein J8A68_005621 [[Candida] subhashii]KAG7660804.1 hypothetical protein J8A68_005621 [[Candida] subhashii]
MADNSSIPLSISNEVIPIHYHYKLNINHLKPNFSGEAIIKLSKNCNKNASEEPQGVATFGFSLTLHASRLIITKATIGDVPLKVTYDKPNQRITFSSPEDAVIDSTLDDLYIKYMGQIKTIGTFKDNTSGLFKTNYLDSISGKANNYILATHFQPHFAKEVFPIIDELTHKPTIALDITTNTKFKVMTNGRLVSSEYVDENTLSKFEYDLPITPAVMGFVIGDFEYIQSELLSNVRIYTSIGESKYARFALSIIEKYLPILESKFGHKYPLSKLDFVTLPFLNDGAMENWGLVTVLGSSLLIDEASASQPEKNQVVELVVHELVHQWIGNWVSFDNWNLLWFNESFATWLAKTLISNDVSYEELLDRDCFYVDEKYSIGSIQEHMSTVYTGLNATTSTIFDTNMYEKGIVLLNMIHHVFKSENKDLVSSMTKVISQHQNKSIKLFDIWQVLNEEISIDLPSFVYSWSRAHGFPLVQVTSNEDGSKIHIEQHAYLYNLTAEQVGLEDIPYHIPLLIDVVKDNGERKLLNIVLTDRSMELDIPIEQFVAINTGRGGYYRVLYDRLSNIHLMEPDTIIGVLNDLGKILGTSNSTSNDLINFIQFIETFTKKIWKWDWQVILIAVGYLESINHNLLHFTECDAFSKWLQGYSEKLFNRVNWNKTYSIDYDPIEIQARASILQLNLHNKHAYDIAHKLYIQFLNSGINKSFTPKELIPALFNVMMTQASMKEYKQVLAFVKNANSSILNQTNLSENELQTIAVSSLSFPNNSQFLHKTLNFISNNIDSKLIELGLIGFTYSMNVEHIHQLYVWFNLNYDNWILRSLRKGSDWSKQIGVTAKNITKLVLELMNRSPDLIQLKQEFVAKKILKLPEHGLKKLNEEIEVENESKLVVAKFYPDLEKWLVNRI